MPQTQLPILGDSYRESNFKAFRLHDIHNCRTSLELGLSSSLDGLTPIGSTKNGAIRHF